MAPEQKTGQQCNQSGPADHLSQINTRSHIQTDLLSRSQLLVLNEADAVAATG